LLYAMYALIYAFYAWDLTEPMMAVQTAGTALMTTLGPPMVLLSVVLTVSLGVGLFRHQLPERRVVEPGHDLVERGVLFVLSELERGTHGVYVRTKGDDVLPQLVIPTAQFLHPPGIVPRVLQVSGEALNGRIDFIWHKCDRDFETDYRVVPGWSPSRVRDQPRGNIALRTLKKNQCFRVALQRRDLRIPPGEMSQETHNGAGCVGLSQQRQWCRLKVARDDPSERMVGDDSDDVPA